MISVIGVSLGTMALIIVLSAFNGLNVLVTSLFGSFDPDLKILPVAGKTFIPNSPEFAEIKKLDKVLFYAEALEDNALLKYANRQRPAIVKGVSEEFALMTGIDTMIIDGKFILEEGKQDYAVLGFGVAGSLGIGLNFIDPIKFYVPKRNAKVGHNPIDAFRMEYLFPKGVFTIQEEFDSQYVLVPMDFARSLFGRKEAVSAIEIKLKDIDESDEVQKYIQNLLGDDFVVKNRFQQHDVLFKMMKSEKMAIFFILAFILIIASFNIIGSLSMLIIDKQNDIETLRSIGANKTLIQRIFLIEGWLISLSGALIGTVLGIAICLLQLKYGFVKLGGADSFIFSEYPVKLVFVDVLIVFVTVVIIGYLASRLPVRYLTKKFLNVG
ncbi:FtsX-like permease family protein [Ancylomarina sp. DW003]|nr:FtsX-like permease family protein [Ancylomarina sp. DW003]MDE5424077.1 FtsX-like permease family protein [Ancylomarina sp. DW003]